MEILGKDRIDYLVGKAVYIMREARATFKKPGLLFAGGKDSCLMTYIASHMTFPDDYMFPVIFLDTSFAFAETYNYLDMVDHAWNLHIQYKMNKEALAKGMNPKDHSRQECCYYLKTKPLNDLVEKEGYDALLVAIRHDEHAIRSLEYPFSPRRLPKHTRVHPMLGFTEQDVWTAIHRYNIPYNSLYDQVIDGKRYRSIGCYPCTKPIYDIEKEREGRAKDKEAIMESMRSLGYL